MKQAAGLIVMISGVMLMAGPVSASGVAARRNADGKPVLQGPPIELGPQKTRAYIPPRTKSVNLPAVLPFEKKEEAPKPVVKPVNSVKPIKPVKPAVQNYPTQVLQSSQQPQASPQNNPALARATNTAPARTALSSGSTPPSEFTALFGRLDQSSEVWVKLNDLRVKTLIVEHYADLYKQFGVQIRKPAVYYANMIDAMAQNNPQLLAQPFDQVLRVVAILEYDYNSGENKDALASGILKDKKSFLQNKQRLGVK